MDASLLFAILFYLASSILVIGLVSKILSYARTPAPLKIPTTPAPVTGAGVVLRMLREVTLFESLFKGNLWIWGAGALFHVGLALVSIRHLRYFTEPVWGWVAALQPFGIYGGLAMLAGLVGLSVRRFAIERIRYISTLSDHLMLALLILIAASGLMMKFVAHTDIIDVKAFFLGLMTFELQTLPNDGLLYIHLTLVATLMIIFPFSKLLHSVGVFFSPSRNQIDNPREVRHRSKWIAGMERN